MEQDYSNREIDRMFKDIMDTLERIETQTTRTNGRVSALEGQRNWAAGAAAVVVPIIGVALAWISAHITGISTS